VLGYPELADEAAEYDYPRDAAAYADGAEYGAAQQW
jgi:hypothetical protein